MEQAYVYKWLHLPTYCWYIGSRTAKKCHPNDGYVCSSKIVKPMILSAPNEWKRTVVAVGKADEMRQLESEILILVDAKNDLRSFNQHNQNGKFVCIKHSEKTKQKIKNNHAFAGKKRPNHAQVMLGRKRNPEDIKKWSAKLIGVKKTLKHIEAIKTGKSQGLYFTPNGVFYSSRDAAKANYCSKASVLNRCCGYFSKTRDTQYPPVVGWRFEKAKS